MAFTALPTTFSVMRSWMQRTFSIPPRNLPSSRTAKVLKLGGPAIKDKAFFFFSYEKLARRESSTVNNTIPTVPMRTGNFSALTAPVFDPQTYDPATRTRQAFPGNIIPANRIDALAKQPVDYYPPPHNT